MKPKLPEILKKLKLWDIPEKYFLCLWKNVDGFLLLFRLDNLKEYVKPYLKFFKLSYATIHESKTI